MPRKLPFLSTAPGDCAAVLYAASFALAVLVSLFILIATAPDHEMAVVIALMLHFIPVLADRASATIEDQSMRDGGFDENGVIARVCAIMPVVTKLFASGLRHVKGFSLAFIDAIVLLP